MFPDVLLRPELAWVAGGAMMVLAGFLVYVAPRDRLMWAFAVFLVLRGSANLPVGAETVLYRDVDDLRIIILPFAALWFLVEYHRRARLRAGSPFTLPLVGLVAVAWLWIYTQGVAMPAWLHPVDVPFDCRFLAYALIALVIAWDAMRRKDPADRWPLLLVSAAFALNPLFYVGAVLHASGFVQSPDSAYFLRYIIQLASILTVGAAAVLVPLRLAIDGGPGRARQVIVYDGVILAVMASLLWLFSRGTFNPPWLDPWAVALERVSTLPVGFVVGYVLLRYRLFDLDLHLKATLFGAIILGAFSAAFFVAQEILETFIPGDNPLLGLVGAGALALAFLPLQRFAKASVQRMMPKVERTPDYLAERKLEVYRSTLESVMSDGALSEKERRMLEAVRAQLGLPVEEAARVERETALRISGAAAPSGAPARASQDGT